MTGEVTSWPEVAPAAPLLADSAFPADARSERAAGAVALQRTGNRLVVAGFVVAITGVVLYCVITFAGNITTDLADILLRNALPAARGSLAVVGAGSLLWLIGSFMHLRGAMDAEDATGAGAP